MICEGEVTEREYFEHVRRTLRDYLFTIEIAKERGDPLQYVKRASEVRDNAVARARREQDDNMLYDQVWCVIDVDEHERLEPALRLSAKEKISVALSNPCFELWILLHFVSSGGHISTRDAARRLKDHMQDYDKHVDCHALQGKYAAARNRAETLSTTHERNGNARNSNPSTDVWLLIEQLLSAARQSNAPGRATDL